MTKLSLLLLLALSAAPKRERWTVVPYRPNIPNRVTPPCRGFVEWDGYCWAPLVSKPPCKTDNAQEHDGRCLLPVVREPQKGDPST